MQRRSILICTLLTFALAAWVVPAQSQVVPRDFDGDGVITPTDYVEELLSLYKGRTAPGLPVVEFSLIDLNGNTQTPVFYKDKVLLLLFLGYDCTGCLVEGGLRGVVAVPETNLALGEIDVGRSGMASFTIRNDGQGPLQVTGFESDLAGVSFSTTSLTILPGASETVTVTVDPAVEGPFSGTIDVLTNDPTQGTLPIPLTGTAVVIPADPRADFDANNTVDFVDFLLFAAAFGTSDSKFDISGNGVVDFPDFLVFAENFGKQVN